MFFLKGAHCAVFFGEKLRGRGSNPRRRSRDAEFTVDRRLSNLRSISFPFPVPRKPLTSPFSLPFPIPRSNLQACQKEWSAPSRGSNLIIYIRLSSSQPLISLLLPPSLSYSLSSISTGSLVRRSLDLGCEARGVRRTLGPGLLSLSLVAQRRCASSTAGRGGAHPPLQHAARRGSGGRQGAASAAARHAARHDVQQLFAAAGGGAPSMTARTLLPAQSGWRPSSPTILRPDPVAEASTRRLRHRRGLLRRRRCRIRLPGCGGEARRGGSGGGEVAGRASGAP